MSKYIKLEDAENKMYQLWEEDTDNKINSAYCFEDDRAIEALRNLPTIDIVHCKDCKHGEYRRDFDNYLCDQLGLGSVNDADFFCSYGERKDNE